MEEDMKIVENLINHIRAEEKLQYGISMYVQAIENVLHDLKYNKAQFEKQLREKLDLQANSIPISVIQNKLEKLKEKEQELSDDEGFWGSSELLYQINVLEELLEERNK